MTCRLLSKLLLFLIVIVIVCATHHLPNVQAAAPARVVSINLCTDQLAMLLAGKEQLISVSYLAARESSSIMVDQAKRIGTNHGLAEEIFRLKPDLVLAGTFTTRATVNLLKKLDIRVEEFPPAYSMKDIKVNLLRMGHLLGQQARALELQKQFERDLLHIKAEQTPNQKVIGSYGANSYTSGFGTLENDIIKAAGLNHMGEALGVKGTIKLPLESLLRAQPDYIMSWQQWSERPGRSTEILHHPVLERSFGKERRLYADSRYWICGLPLVIEAIQHLQHQTQGQAHD